MEKLREELVNNYFKVNTDGIGGHYEQRGFFRVWIPDNHEELKEISKQGYVYYITTDYGSKIGYSRDPKTRISGLVGSLPFDCNFHEYFLVSDCGLVESLLHDIFKEKRIKSEWFHLDIKDIGILKKEVKKWLIKD